MDVSIQTVKPVLAMYDVRGKQKFIYRSTRIKEIIGGSKIIRDIFKDYLFPAAGEYRNEIIGIKTGPALYDYKNVKSSDGSETRDAGKNKKKQKKKNEKGNDFSFDAFLKRMGEEQYLGEIVYDGGGNFLVLYKNREVCRGITRLFSRKVLENTSSLKVQCTFVEDLNPNLFHVPRDPNHPENKGDYERLYETHRYNENQEIVTVPYGMLPVVQTDYLTSMPLTELCETDPGHRAENSKKVTTESAAKYRKYKEVAQNENRDGIWFADEKILDRMVTERGRESLLAVIYIDGNNMGALVQNSIKNAKSYDQCIKALRKFSETIQTELIDKRVNRILQEMKKGIRMIVGAGDEITIICNAREALDIACKYLEDIPKEYSSCAGISVFHSHTPFLEAYRIAEECCESGKKFMKEHGLQSVCLLDYHFCQAAIGVSLEEIRILERMENCSRPWLVVNNQDKNLTKECTPAQYGTDVLKMKQLLNIFGRTNVKSLLDCASEGNTRFDLEVQRIEAHISTKTKEKMQDALGKDCVKEMIYKNKDKARRLIADMAIVYDLWFDDEKDQEEEEA